MIPTDAELLEWQAIADAATGVRWIAVDNPRFWQLFAYARGPEAIEHGYQLIKAPKTGTPYAEYWPRSVDSRLIEITRAALPRCLAEIARLRQLLHAHHIPWDPQELEKDAPHGT